jgi:hypothetical protein
MMELSSFALSADGQCFATGSDPHQAPTGDWEAMSMLADAVVTNGCRTTPVATATVPNARESNAPSGYRLASSVCCPWSTSTWRLDPQSELRHRGCSSNTRFRGFDALRRNQQ